MSDILLSFENDISILIDKSDEPNLLSIDEPIVLSTIEEPIILNTIEEVTSILHTGITGPQGPAGPSGGEDEVAQAKRTDFTTNDTVIYKGEAVPGTSEASALWRVKRLTIASDNDVTEEWADGTADYIKVWDDRYTYTYS